MTSKGLKPRLLRSVVAVAAALAGLMIAAQAGAATFSSTAPITINDGGTCDSPTGQATAPGTASPYPSQISVSGLAGTITDVNVTLTGFMHTYPDDVDVLLVAPNGRATMLMADTGGSFMLQPANLTFDDSASASLLDGTLTTTGTYRPTVGTIYPGGCIVPSSFPAPAPAGPYGTSLSAFDGASPNGTWSLYVIDDIFQDTGSISGGWSLDITVQAPVGAPEISSLQQLVASFQLPRALNTDLNRKLDAALAAVDAGDSAAACDSMRAFVKKVATQSGKKLTAAQAQQLSDAAIQIETLLGC